MKTKSLLIFALATLATTTSAFAADGDGYAERSGAAPRGSIVVCDGPRYMSFYDYFFNNPVKSRTTRFDPGEYYQGVTRVYNRP
ncbi:hypothetical protein GR138_03360 [Shinella kummerowiae]|jgi:hypothetical protein|uniref:Uncharacterized protein n=1 Tax=Shinella kummerowiae TaxID=417745 RepID=A0A6N8SB69_9HYPH|nr:hypothetical protein [Shinella kummerowiae]MXN44212.1 hypothetical protein [Shinella kummerowiae]